MYNFSEIFSSYQGKRIAIYGLGIETEKVLKEIGNKFCVKGLLDSFLNTGMAFDYPVIPFDEVIEQKVELIVVVARPGSCKAIAEKIADKCRNGHIALFDIRGNDLLQPKEIRYDFSAMEKYTRTEICERISQVEVVSFDLFDTLITRTILRPTDVVDLVDERLKEQNIIIDDFARRGLRAEKKLSITAAPTLQQIYCEMLEETEDMISVEELAQIEFETDLSLVIPRRDSVELMKYARENGKKVCITTDTYYSYNQIEKILNQCEITEFDELLVSCEFGIGKTNGLFGVLKEKNHIQSILHIGDDEVADIEKAHENGIMSQRIYNGVTFYDELSGLGLNPYMFSISERLRVGMFVARIFNSPFQFETQDNHIIVNSVIDFSYLFCAPMIMDFTQWYLEKIEECGITNNWLGARDGYLLEKICNLLSPKQEVLYFLTSRISAIRAGVIDENDIYYVDQMKFSGTLEQNLYQRFGILPTEVEEGTIQEEKSGLLRYSCSILEQAKQLRKHYRKYIEQGFQQEGDISFVDFVAKGTVQLFLNKIVPDRHIHGFYFLQLEKQNMAEYNLDITAFYNQTEAEKSAIYDNYYILETILTAPHASVQCFDIEGRPVFSTETRNSQDLMCVSKAQDGIIEYVEQMLRICPKAVLKINKEMDGKMLELLHHVEVTDADFLQMMVEDPFFNRMTKITNVL